MGRLTALGGLAMVVFSLQAWPADEGSPPVTYKALYRVERGGESTGVAEIALTYDAERRVYDFSSSTKMSGALRLLVPRPVIERSTFAYEGGRIVPIAFSYEDGRKGEDNQRMQFDWGRNVAVTSAPGQTAEVELQPGALDRASLQVAVMRDMRSGKTAAQYLLADGSSLATAETVRVDEATVETPFGPLVTQRVVQSREGSSRALMLWMAPELSFLPVRIEQQKDGKTQVALILQSVDGLGAGGA